MPPERCIEPERDVRRARAPAAAPSASRADRVAQPLDRLRRSRRRGRPAPPSRAAGAPSRPTASAAARRPRSSAGARARSSSGSLPHASQIRRAISATVSSSRRGDVEVLVLAGGRGHRRDDPVGDVVDVRQRSRLLAGAEDLERPLAGQRLGDQVRDRVRDPGLVGIGQLARPVRVERAADRVAQAVLVVRGARVHLAGELREPVCRAGRRAVEQVGLGGRELGRALEHHRGGDVDEALDVAGRSRR